MCARYVMKFRCRNQARRDLIHSGLACTLKRCAYYVKKVIEYSNIEVRKANHIGTAMGHLGELPNTSNEMRIPMQLSGPKRFVSNRKTGDSVERYLNRCHGPKSLPPAV